MPSRFAEHRCRPRKPQAQGRRRGEPGDDPVLLRSGMLLPLPGQGRGGRDRCRDPARNHAGHQFRRDQPDGGDQWHLGSRLGRPAVRGVGGLARRPPAGRGDHRGRAVHPVWRGGGPPLPLLHAQPGRAQLRDLPFAWSEGEIMSAAETLRAEAARRILVKDGAYGTSIQARRLKSDDYRGELDLAKDQRGNNDLLNLTRPGLIEEIATEFAEAGVDILATNTFNANAISQADYGAEAHVADINRAAARIVRGVADRYSQRDGQPRWVAGALGPTNKTLSLSPDVNDPAYREVDFDTVKDVYREQIDALVEGGVDFILIETVFDTLNAKAAIMATLEAEQALSRELPLMVSMTLTDLSGRNLSGHTVEAFWATVRHAKPVTIGLNCSFGAAQLRPHLVALNGLADTLIMAYPNAGLPNELGEYDEAAAETAAQIHEWFEAGLVNIVGGCCGTTPAHIAAIAEAARGRVPRKVPTAARQTLLAGLEPMVIAA